VVAHIAVAIGGLVRSVFKSRFNRAVRKARFVGRFDAVVLKIALAKVLGAAVVRVASAVRSLPMYICVQASADVGMDMMVAAPKARPMPSFLSALTG
jgi:hypothetical protein